MGCFGPPENKLQGPCCGDNIILERYDAICILQKVAHVRDKCSFALKELIKKILVVYAQSTSPVSTKLYHLLATIFRKGLFVSLFFLNS